MSRPCSRPTWRSCSLPTWKCYTNGVIHQTAFLLYDTEWAEERLEQDEQRNAWSVSRTSATINLKIKLLFMVRKKQQRFDKWRKTRPSIFAISVSANYDEACLSSCSILIFSPFTAKSVQIMNYESLNCTLPNNGKIEILQYIVRLMHSQPCEAKICYGKFILQKICLPLFRI